MFNLLIHIAAVLLVIGVFSVATVFIIFFVRFAIDCFRGKGTGSSGYPYPLSKYIH